MIRSGTILIAAFLVATTTAQQKPPLQVRLGYAPDARVLVIHADDLGMSHSVNRATLEALERRWITSSSILVPCPWFPEVARWAREHPDADLGIHLAVNSEWTGFRWGPLSSRDAVSSLLDKDGYLPLLEDDVVAKAKPAEIERELRAQVESAQGGRRHAHAPRLAHGHAVSGSRSSSTSTAESGSSTSCRCCSNASAIAAASSRRGRAAAKTRWSIASSRSTPG